ncbi:MAG TPA: PadR family transcriptional regulator [Thermoplasmata archaeon]|nr:PadR family transcriptional regulator [Thermoplasmata archaeon]
MSLLGAPWMGRHRRGLRPLVYHLLSQGPKTGAELMDEIEHLSRGFWRPSPGSIYPLLEEMTRDGAVRKGTDGRYALTAGAGPERGWAPGRVGPRNVEEALVELRGLVAFLEDLKSSRSGEFDKATPEMKDVAERLARIAG